MMAALGTRKNNCCGPWKKKVPIPALSYTEVSSNNMTKGWGGGGGVRIIEECGYGGQDQAGLQ